jgi:ribonuclease BN (tRNA processing enzyme)
MPQPDRVNSGYVLDISGRLIQFDCGGGISSAFRRAGFDPLAVERIVISHTHSDHVSDLPLFIQMMYLAEKEIRRPMYIHLPGEALDFVRSFFRTLYLFPEKLPLDIEFISIPEDGAIEFEGVSILPIRNSHLKGNADVIDEYNMDNRMQCYSYLIRVNGKTILYSADLGSEADLLRISIYWWLNPPILMLSIYWKKRSKTMSRESS